MSRLKPNSVLLKTKSQKVPHLKHFVLIFMLFKELKGDWSSTTTGEIANLPLFNLNKANQILRRMRDYGYIKGHKEETTTFLLEGRDKPNYRTTITVKGTELPEELYRSDIIEEKTKRAIQWSLTKTGREFAKCIWLDPDKYNVRHRVDIYTTDLCLLSVSKEINGNDYADFLFEEARYKINLEEKEKVIKLSEKVEELKKNFNETQVVEEGSENKNEGRIKLLMGEKPPEAVDILERQSKALQEIRVEFFLRQYFESDGYRINNLMSKTDFAFEVVKDGLSYEVIIIEKTPEKQSLELAIPALIQIKDQYRKVKICFVDMMDRWNPVIKVIDIS